MDPKLLEVLTAANSAQYAPLVPGLLVLAEDGLPHEDATTGEESVREDVVVNATRTLVVFDFDCTITSVHLFHTLHGGADGGAAANEELRADPAAFYTRICGGEARVALLRAFLQGLSAAGATLRILSFGHEDEIEACLVWLEVRSLFDAVHGSASYSSHGIRGGRGSKQKMVGLYLLTDAMIRVGSLPRTYDHLVFVDDDRSNFPSSASGTTAAVVSRRKEPPAQLFDAWRLASDAVDGAVLVAWPAGEAKNAAGLDKRACERLTEFVCNSGGGGGGGAAATAPAAGGVAAAAVVVSGGAAAVSDAAAK
jgi:hypothetical protein|tara:strand:+ start:51 stop:980 length:930 start_codon:yes stop_codon:yes gene_type:complete